MITDNIRNRAKYYALGDDIRMALDYFASIRTSEIANEDIKLPDSNITVKLRPMMTRHEDECTFEIHKEHIDIHFVAYGTEHIGYADVEELNELSYDKEQDVAFLEGSGDFITLRSGCFMITFPDDAHMPGVCKGEPSQLGKMIAKIKTQEDMQ